MSYIEAINNAIEKSELWQQLNKSMKSKMLNMTEEQYQATRKYMINLVIVNDPEVNRTAQTEMLKQAKIDGIY